MERGYRARFVKDVRDPTIVFLAQLAAKSNNNNIASYILPTGYRCLKESIVAVLDFCVLEQRMNGVISDHYIDYLRVLSSLWITLRHVLTDHKLVLINPHTAPEP